MLPISERLVAGMFFAGNKAQRSEPCRQRVTDSPPDGCQHLCLLLVSLSAFF